MSILSRLPLTTLLLSALVAPAQVSSLPKLRLANTVVGPVTVAQGANAPAQEVETYDAGQGGLQLTVSSSSPWIRPTVGAVRPCAHSARGCQPVRIELQTASLARGMHSGTVLVRAQADALDAPQEILVTVQVGGGVPDRLDFFVAPNGGADTATLITNSPVRANASTASGGGWLSVALEGTGSFRFVLPYQVRAQHLPGMGEGVYSGAIGLAGSAFAGDNKTVDVSLRVTSQPLAAASPRELSFKIAPGVPKQRQFIAVSNRGLGTLSIGEIAVGTASGGNWLSAERVAGTDLIAVSVDTAVLAPGPYTGTVNIASNAANGPITIPVRLEVVNRGAPLVKFQGVVNNATFAGGEQLAPGMIAAVFGEQLSYEEPAGATSLPLGEALGGARVLVNGRPAPIFFSSYGQLNFQVPYDTPPGEAIVQVERAGQAGNRVAVSVAPAAPRILLLRGDYGIVVNQDGSFPVPASLGIAGGRPARRGETLVIYAIGLGATTPGVASGAAAPSTEPLARVDPLPKVFFGASGLSQGVAADPLFAGLTPGFVGLYQLNVTIPDNAPQGDSIGMFLQCSGNVTSNRVLIAIQ